MDQGNGRRELEFVEYLLSGKENERMPDMTVRFLGQRFLCDRVYIFEIHYESGTFDNTYEWCADGVEPQIDLLKGEMIELIHPWLDVFKQGKPIVIDDVEKIKDEMPAIYTVLKPQNIHSLVAVAIRSHGEITGFIGLDNPSGCPVEDIIHFLNIIVPTISLMIKGYNDILRFEQEINFDDLTGAHSAYSLDMLLKNLTIRNPGSIGIVFSDVLGLRVINENYGRAAGDEAIKASYDLMLKVFPNEHIYRVNGDSFVVVVIGCDMEYFEKRLAKLRRLVQNHGQYISIGSSYTSEKHIDFAAEFQKAESDMIAQREAYQRSVVSLTNKTNLFYAPGSEFETYVQNNFFNLEMLIKSMTADEGSVYIYFGDLQTNNFYISDNMRDDFGFESNIVSNMMELWADRITNSSERQMYLNDTESMLAEKRGTHDLRYRVKDRYGNYVWVRCRGELLWSLDKSIPLFFSGCLLKQEYEFTVDPVTNFMREAAAVRRLSTIPEGVKRTIIGFSLNSFSEINELYGKGRGDELLKDISKRLVEDFEDKVHFYRLDGLRFAAILDDNCTEDPEAIISSLRYLINLRYRHHGVAVHTPCSMTVLDVNADEMTPREMISNTILLLNIAKSSRDRDYVVRSIKSIEEQHAMAEMIFELTKNVQNDCENFRIVVQPSVSVRDEKIVSGEALLRWTFKGRNISPSIFVPLLEKYRLIYAVGEWLFEQVVKATIRVHTIDPSLDMAFNVSYLQVLDSNFFPYMKEILANYKLNAGRLILELTETNFDESPQKLSDFFNSCMDLGIQVALDDFGNGYSSLGMLLKHPTDIVKLDKSLLNEMSTSEDKQKFINSIVYACHAFGKTVCAEGIETQAELELMRDADCDNIQGYYYSKPLELNDYYRFVAEYPKK